MSEDDKKLENQIGTAENNNNTNEKVKLEVENEASPEKQEDNIPEEIIVNEERIVNNEVIHKKDGRLHIYVRQDKYKGELKSKNCTYFSYIH